MLLSKFIRIIYIKPTKNIPCHIIEEFIFYADKIMVMGNSKNMRVFNFAILLKLLKFCAREIYMFYSTLRDIVIYVRKFHKIFIEMCSEIFSAR